jgi:Ca-activated chloride channel family protein
MSELTSVHDLSFNSPNYLWALLVVPLLLALVLAIRLRRARYRVTFTNLDVLGVVVKKRRGWRGGVPLILLALALAAAAAALAQPQAEIVLPEHNATVILLVDVSGSMAAGDVSPTRMTAAVNSMHIFLGKLPKTDKVGLVTFSNKSQIIDQPTLDRATVNSGLDVLSPEAGTALGEGVITAVHLIVSTLAAAGVHHKPGEYLPAAIVLESDGAQNRGTVTPFTAANLARAEGIRIYGVALGTPGGKVTEGSGLAEISIPVPPDPGTVALLARTTGGQAASATDSNTLDSIYRNLGTTVGRHTEQLEEITGWFEIAAALLLIAGVGIARAWGASLP